MLDNILIINLDDENNWDTKEFKKNNITVRCTFKKVNKICRAVRRVWFDFNLPFTKIWYRNWVDKVKKSQYVIIMASRLTMNLPSYINNINPNAKVIMWYWNTVDKYTLPQRIIGDCELWSFDSDDCKKYNMKFNHQYYFKSRIKTLPNEDIDLYFCGLDKGRSPILVKLYNYCLNNSIKPKIQIVSPSNKMLPEELISKRVSYDEICENIASSKAVLEITKSQQSGVTLRAMEALFFGKKLVTDNSNIKNEDFYSKNNCFIIGEDPIEGLKDFLYTVPFVPYDQSLLDKYDVKQWIKNFENTN